MVVLIVGIGLVGYVVQAVRAGKGPLGGVIGGPSSTRHGQLRSACSHGAAGAGLAALVIS
jgi:hypothetical protein